MNNKGQTTIFFSLLISVLLVFTLSALELGRIYMSHVKEAAVVQSTKQSVAADYNRELFERYHLLFADPTYGTGSEAVVEEKIKDYIETSLVETQGNIYDFSVDDICVVEESNVLSENMKRLKEQIEEYEKTEGIVHRAKFLSEQIKGNEEGLENAARETENNAVQQTVKKEETEDKKENNEEDKKIEKEKDPRDSLKEALKFGVLEFVKPEGMDVSKKEMDFSESPSQMYEDQKMVADDKDNSFQKIDVLKTLLKKRASEKVKVSEKAALLDYADYHFSNGVNKKNNCVMKCEMEYILEGKKSDYENMDAVVDEIIWMRMPVNYAYLLTDAEKKNEALTLATAICAATNTEALIEVVKYLLIGCWSYGETLCEMKDLLRGEKVEYVKNASNWKTDLKAPTVSKNVSVDQKAGMTYEDYLLLLMAKKNNKSLNKCYARMLDVMEKNMQQEDPTFRFENYVYKLVVQGKISIPSLFVEKKDSSVYDYYFEEEIEY